MADCNYPCDMVCYKMGFLYGGNSTFHDVYVCVCVIFCFVTAPPQQIEHHASANRRSLFWT